MPLSLQNADALLDPEPLALEMGIERAGDGILSRFRPSLYAAEGRDDEPPVPSW